MLKHLRVCHGTVKVTRSQAVEPGPYANTTQTWPLAKGMRCPSGNVKLVPLPRNRRDQCTRYARPSLSTTALPLPTVFAYGGLTPRSRKTDPVTRTLEKDMNQFNSLRAQNVTSPEDAASLKQQAEMSGALLAGLLRYGYRNIYQIHNAWWRKIVADDLGITTHHSKWGKGIIGKMRPKEWSLGAFNNYNAEFPNDVPLWPDLIADSKNGGRKAQPEGSRASPLQPDDRYQALPMALWVMREEQEQNFS